MEELIAFKFKSLYSGSSGNAYLLWTSSTAVLIDFAPGSQRACREALAEAAKTCGQLAAVVVTHAHGDHINRNSLKVLEEAGLKVFCHPGVRQQILARHGSKHAGIISSFTGHLALGDLISQYTEVDHAPGYHTTAFTFTTKRGNKEHKASVFTDFSRFTEAHAAFAANSDLLLLEANHDAALLKQFGHPGSEFHLSNLKAAEFLHRVCQLGAAPQAVVLGHLSGECNAPHLPPKEIKEFFGRNGLPVKFRIQVAKRSEPGIIIVLR